MTHDELPAQAAITGALIKQVISQELPDISKKFARTLARNHQRVYLCCLLTVVADGKHLVFFSSLLFIRADLADFGTNPWFNFVPEAVGKQKWGNTDSFCVTVS